MRADFLACREKPLQVTASWRGAHLVLLASLLAFPLILMFSVPLFGLSLCQIGDMQFRYQIISQEQSALKDLEAGSLNEVAAGQTLPGEGPRLAAAVLRASDLRLAGRLRQQIDEETRIRESVYRSARPLARSWLAYITVGPDDVLLRPNNESRHFRIRAEEAASVRHFSPDITRGIILAVMGVVLFFPALWVAWAFVVRGAVSLRLMGLSLLRSNGRPALRIQCAWRALVVWVPIVGLLMLAALLDLLPWASGVPNSDFGWTYWLSWLCWVLALALLPLYALLAIRFPERSLHDRLAGTYVVPR